MRRFGIALGGGGAKGLAHILMFEALDELGVKPHRISGTSIGAILGALYAAGVPTPKLKSRAMELSLNKEGSAADVLVKGKLLKWFEFIELPRDRSGLLSVDKFLANLSNELKAKSFEELNIPLTVVASDFWRREPVIFREGPLIEAIHASMALPGIFAPVVQNGRVLIDGGAVNPLPFDLLFDDCDVVVAVNVMGQRNQNPDAVPSVSEAIFNTFQIMQRTILNEKLKHKGPDILIEPQLTGIKVLEFFKAEDIFRQAASAKQDLKRDLKKLLVD